MSAELYKIHVGIISDDNEQLHIIRSALLPLGFKVCLTSEPQHLENKWFSSTDIQLWIVDLAEQDRWDSFIDQIIDQSPAALLFNDGHAPPNYSDKYLHWQSGLLDKISKLLNLDKIVVADNILNKPIEAMPTEYNNIVQVKKNMLDSEGAFSLENKQDKSDRSGLFAKRVWVLGASLGGPAAVKLFLDALEPNLPIAFILAQHIDEKFQALLGQVLARNNHFELIQEFDRIQLKHGQILIAPAVNAIFMDTRRHVLRTSNGWQGIYSPSINQVMKLVADNYGQHSGAIIFSGMGDDSAASAEYMTSLGGTIWAQSKESCENSSQPDSTRETGCVSYNGSPQQLAEKLMMTLQNA